MSHKERVRPVPVLGAPSARPPRTAGRGPGTPVFAAVISEAVVILDRVGPVQRLSL